MARIKVLLINGESGRYWTESLRRAVSGLGGTLMLADHRHVESIVSSDYELIILDANVTCDLARVINHICSQDPVARIVVVSPAPHWKQAREALLEGAVDYTRKVDNEAAIMNVLRESLSRTPLLRQNQSVKRR